VFFIFIDSRRTALWNKEEALRYSVGITLTCDITGSAGIREWTIGICGHEQGSPKWHIGITRGR